MLEHISVGDTIVIQDLERTNKRVCGEVQSKYNGAVKLEVSNAYGDCEIVEAVIGNTHEIIAHLGSNPKSGTAYGCQVRKIYSQSEHPFWGVITFFREITEDESTALKKALKSAKKHLDVLGISKVIQLDNLMITPAKGRFAGYYKQDKHGNHIGYHPRDITPKTSTFLLDHELAHAIWFQLLTDKVKASWVSLYTKYVESIKVDDTNLMSVIDIMCEESRTLTEYYELVSDIDEGETWFNKIETALMEKLLLTYDDLDLYIWSLSPKKRRRIIEGCISNISPVDSDYSESFPVSEYARKNTSEFFAEAYCHYISLPRVIPEDVEELLIKSIPHIKSIKGTGTSIEED